MYVLAAYYSSRTLMRALLWNSELIGASYAQPRLRLKEAIVE